MQIARSHGARVIGTASAQDHYYVRNVGAEPVTYGAQRALAADGTYGKVVIEIT